MKRLYVLDFDKTMIPYDSWGLFLRKLLLRFPVTVGMWLFMRKLNYINRRELKQRIALLVEKKKRLEEFSYAFMKEVCDDIYWPLEIHDGGDDKTVIILSASPMCYLHYLNDFIGSDINVVGSGIYNGVYVEMYGENKMQYLLANYSRSEYSYEYAISDSESDLIWMKNFKRYEIKP